MSLTLNVEPDTHKQGMWMIVLRDERNELVGIPVRGESLEYVHNIKKYIAYATQYGISYSKQRLWESLQQFNDSVTINTK